MNISAIFSLSIAILSGCAFSGDSPNREFRSALSPDCNRILEFSDQTFRLQYGYISFFRCESVFVVRYRRVGYTDATWFFKEHISEDLRKKAAKLAGVVGKSKGREGEFAFAAYVDGNGISPKEYFDEETPQFVEFFKALQIEVVKMPFQTNGLPTWLENDPRFSKRSSLRKH
jgi:hypothetical protein